MKQKTKMKIIDEATKKKFTTIKATQEVVNKLKIIEGETGVNTYNSILEFLINEHYGRKNEGSQQTS